MNNIPAVDLIDGYKTSHRPQYPENTNIVYTNGTPRKSRVPGINNIVWFGLQYLIIRYFIREFNETFFSISEDIAVTRYKRRMDNYLGKDAVLTDGIRALHRLGYLPIRIKALKEGTKVPIKVAPFTIVNTKHEFFWLTNYLETLISSVIWGPCTSATTANEYKKILIYYAKETVGDDLGFVQWQAHDFSMRGMFGPEAAMMSGAAHLLSFFGSDTVPAIDWLEEYYGADCEKEIIAGSIPATEHSVMCMGGQEDEIGTFRRLLSLYPTGPFAVVSDTWDYWTVLTRYTVILKKEILARNGKIVFRPDSGNPVRIICGYRDNEVTVAHGADRSIIGYTVNQTSQFITIEEKKGSVEVLWDVFGGTMTQKGYRLLDSHVGLIYGDSITLDICREICERLKEKGFASYNIVFGIGSFTYQYVTRDTYGWAMKATYGEIAHPAKGNGDTGFIESREIFKNPKTDDGGKRSAKGLLSVMRQVGGIIRDDKGNEIIIPDTLVMFDQCTWEQEAHSLLETVFEDGRLVRTQTLAEIREILAKQL